MAMAFQSPVLYPQLNVRENLAIGWRLRYNKGRRFWWGERQPTDLRQRLDEVVPLLELDGLLGRPPTALSGGQRQRVALGRCLVRRPAVFLLDEPLAYLDPALAARLAARLRACFRAWRSTVLWVTHSPQEARGAGDRVVTIADGKLLDEKQSAGSRQQSEEEKH